MKLSKREFNLLMILMILGLGYVYNYHFLQPRLNDLNIIKEQNRQMSFMMAGAGTNDDSASKVSSLSRQTYQEYLYKIPEQPYEAEIIEALSQCADDSRAQLRNIKIDFHTEVSVNEASSASMKAIPIELELSGRYDNLLNFLSSVEKGERLFTLKLAVFQAKNPQYGIFNPISASGTAGEIDLKINLNAYYDSYNPSDMRGVRDESY
ncbi:MAG: type 4a pilus biogenesis protein PilO [Syntrophomonadaceae bacterium]|jgi:Tfp pilus assembly protein PilO|nr:type 4a pilus biogenesis protein PilO [Syntrophomonadaceae bacterium]